MDAAAAARLDHEHGLLYGDVARAGLKTSGVDCAAGRAELRRIKPRNAKTMAAKAFISGRPQVIRIERN
jgi:hypothetical protein